MQAELAEGNAFNSHDRADRFLVIVEAAARFKAQSFLIDGEVVIARDDGTPDFHPFRSQRCGSEAVLFAFDLIEHDGDDLRDLPVIDCKRRLAKLIGKAKRRAVTRDRRTAFPKNSRKTSHARRCEWASKFPDVD
jgi:ATP-dependent DNA ligase